MLYFTGAGFYYHLIRLKFNPKKFLHYYTYINFFIKNVNSRLYSLPMNTYIHQLYLLEQHSESFKSWSAIIRINTEGKSFLFICLSSTFVGSACSFGFFTLATAANDLRLRRISIPDLIHYIIFVS